MKNWLIKSMLLFFVGASLAACGEEDGEEQQNNNSSAEVESEDPKIGIEPGRLDFSETIAPGEEEELSVTFTNVGGEPLELSDFGFNPIGSDAYSQGSNWPFEPIILEPLETYELSVVYKPDDDSRHTGTLQMNANDPEWPNPSVFLNSPAYTP